MKYEWKKQEKDLYLPKEKPAIINVPKQKYFMIDGKGNPNEPDFSERVGVLYSLAYAVRMMPKSGYIPDDYFEYTVYPLEGVWNCEDIADKSTFEYTIMIKQPAFVNDEVAKRAFETVKKKKPHTLLSEAYFCETEGGKAVQMLHVGDYDNEPVSFAIMQKFIDENGLSRKSGTHTEIYLSDVNKVERDKLKTVLRYSIE